MQNRFKKRSLVKCQCNTCGIDHEVYYDEANDYYICLSCYEQEEIEDEEIEDDYPLDMNYGEFKRSIN
jgi:hypothetical protein